MLIVQITGGLGNQMFQYAAGKALSLHLQTPLKLDLQSFKREILPELEVPRDFDLSAFTNFDYIEATETEISCFRVSNKISNRVEKLIPAYRRKIYTEPSYTFDVNFFKTKEPAYLKGHRQSEKYFKPYSKEIKEIYKLKHVLIKDVEEWGNKMKTENSVAIHIRRGDYLRLPIILDWHGVLEKEYYFNAIESILPKANNVKLYYFTNDIEWVNKELLSRYPGVVVSQNISQNHYEDFYLMQSCKHNIIANSSFSWWAAWLNPNPNKIVIAPNKWFNNAPYDTRDLIPAGWIKL